MEHNQPRKNYLKIKPEDQAKIDKRLKQLESQEVEPEWLMIAEFGMLYGWQAIEAVLLNEISMELMTILITAGRKLENRRTYNGAVSSFVGSLASQTKDPADTFKKLTTDLLKSMQPGGGTS